MYVVIAGGGNTGFFVAERMVDAGHQVRIIEKDKSVTELSKDRSRADWLWGNAADPETQEEAEIGRAGAVLALTGADEDNLVISQLAKQEFGVAMVLGRINNPRNAWLFDAGWGVDVAVNTSDMIGRVVAEEVTLGDLVSLLKLAKGKLELVELAIPEDSPAAGRPLGEIALPPDCVVVAILRDDRVVFPRTDLSVQGHDEVLAVVSLQHEEALHKALGSTRKR